MQTRSSLLGVVKRSNHTRSLLAAAAAAASLAVMANSAHAEIQNWAALSGTFSDKENWRNQAGAMDVPDANDVAHFKTFSPIPTW